MSQPIVTSILITTIIDFFLVYFSCALFLNKRKLSPLAKYSLAFLTISVTLSINLFIKFSIINAILIVLSLYIAMSFLFKTDKLKLLLSIITIYGIIICCYLLTAILWGFNFSDYQLLLKLSNATLPILFISKLLEITLLGLMRTKLQYQMTINDNLWLKFTFTMLLILFLLLLYLTNNYQFIIAKDYFIPLILVFINFFLYFNLNDLLAMNSELRLKSINEERMKAELHLWQELKEKDEKQKQLMHDYNNMMIVANGLLKEHKIAELKNYMANLSTEYKSAHSLISTGDELVDILINHKHEKALNNQITLITKLSNLSTSAIKSEDLIIIIGNLLDNAIEYCLKTDLPEKVIYLFIENSENEYSILVRNPLLEKPIIKNNIIESSKNKGNHGIGLSNVKKVAEKYKGEIIINTDNGYFSYLLMFLS